MKRTALLALFCLLFSAAFVASAQETKDKPMTHSMKGYLVDKMCATGMAKKAPDEAMAKAAKHTKSCALEESCFDSGYGLMSEGKWYKFDDAGDKLALGWLKKTEKKDNLMVMVTGTHDGDLFNVTSIKEVKSEGSKKKTEKMEPKHEDMKMDDTKKN